MIDNVSLSSCFFWVCRVSFYILPSAEAQTLKMLESLPTSGDLARAKTEQIKAASFVDDRCFVA